MASDAVVLLVPPVALAEAVGAAGGALAAGRPTVVVVRRAPATVATVEALARIRLEANRWAAPLTVDVQPAPLRRLADLLGLADVLRLPRDPGDPDR